MLLSALWLHSEARVSLLRVALMSRHSDDQLRLRLLVAARQGSAQLDVAVQSRAVRGRFADR